MSLKVYSIFDEIPLSKQNSPGVNRHDMQCPNNDLNTCLLNI